jgi:hypothetical protein
MSHQSIPGTTGMRRDYFSLEIANVDWLDGESDPQLPRVTIDFEGPTATLRSRLTGQADDVLLDAEETDATFRLQTPLDDADAEGVVSLTNRVTGDFVLELNETADTVLRFIRAARRYGEQMSEDARYRIRITIDGDEVVTYDKTTFLVYNKDGNLLRKHSLIPSGVEL